MLMSSTLQWGDQIEWNVPKHTTEIWFVLNRFRIYEFSTDGILKWHFYSTRNHRRCVQTVVFVCVLSYLWPFVHQTNTRTTFRCNNFVICIYLLCSFCHTKLLCVVFCRWNSRTIVWMCVTTPTISNWKQNNHVNNLYTVCCMVKTFSSPSPKKGDGTHNTLSPHANASTSFPKLNAMCSVACETRTNILTLNRKRTTVTFVYLRSTILAWLTDWRFVCVKRMSDGDRNKDELDRKRQYVLMMLHRSTTHNRALMLTVKMCFEDSTVVCVWRNRCACEWNAHGVARHTDLLNIGVKG